MLEGSAAELPEELTLGNYACDVRWRLVAINESRGSPRPMLWDVLLRDTIDKNRHLTVASRIASDVMAVVEEVQKSSVRDGTRRSMQLSHFHSYSHTRNGLRVCIEHACCLQVFRMSARLVLMDGIYNLTEGIFKGSSRICVHPSMPPEYYEPVESAPLGFGPLGWEMGVLTPIVDEQVVLRRYCGKLLWDLSEMEEARKRKNHCQSNRTRAGGTT